MSGVHQHVPQYPAHYPTPPPSGSANPDFAQQQYDRGFNPPQYAAGPTGHGPAPSATPAPPNFGTVYVAPPAFQVQPWVTDFIDWFSSFTTGVARIDLCRPTAPLAHQYGGHLLFADRNKPRPQYPPQFARDPGPIHPAMDVSSWAAYGGQQQPSASPQTSMPRGARIKITRSIIPFRDHKEPGRAPWLDLGFGLSVEMNPQQVLPVARIKIKDWVSIKAVPLGIVRIAKRLKITRNLCASLHYEVPLMNVHEFWKPPARLLARLDYGVGSGLHITPSGVEFDDQVWLAKHTRVHAAGALSWPRELPLDPATYNITRAVRFDRLTLKTDW